MDEKRQQEDNGLFRHHPGITGLAVTAFLRHPHNQYAEADNPFIQKAINVLLATQQPNGGIYNVEMQPALPNYNTSVALMALSLRKESGICCGNHQKHRTLSKAFR